MDVLRTAVLVSGGGTNLQALIDYQAGQGSSCPYEIVCVISDSKKAFALERAAKAVRAAASKGAEGLRHMRDRLQQEIKTAENNILFFTAKSKTANKLVESMQKKIDELKKQLDDIQTQLDNEE